MDVAHAIGEDTNPRLAALMREADALLGTIAVANVLAASGRSLDLVGLDETTGRMCAAILDLDPGQGQHLRFSLCAVLAAVDDLEATLRGPNFPP